MWVQVFSIVGIKVLFMVRLSVVLYSAGYSVKSVKVDLSGLSWRSFCLVHVNMSFRYGWILFCAVLMSWLDESVEMSSAYVSNWRFGGELEYLMCRCWRELVAGLLLGELLFWLSAVWRWIDCMRWRPPTIQKFIADYLKGRKASYNQFTNFASLRLHQCKTGITPFDVVKSFRVTE